MTELTQDQIIKQYNKLTHLGDWLRYTEQLFLHYQLYFGHGTDNAWDEAVWLVLHALKLPLNADRSELERALTAEDKSTCIELILRRIKERKPLAYLLKQMRFAGLDFYVDERVLIPRSSLVELIENHFQPWLPIPNINNILEIGTGSGCIAIACAKFLPAVKVLATDISSSALTVADINIKQHGLSDRVHLLHSDLFASIPAQKFDIIISNPPYVDALDMDQLPAEYLHEPQLALSAGEDGLACVIPILQQVQHFLAPHGIVVLEVGNSEVALQQRYPTIPFFWLEFERSEGGVLLLTYEQLSKYTFHE